MQIQLDNKHWDVNESRANVGIYVGKSFSISCIVCLHLFIISDSHYFETTFFGALGVHLRTPKTQQNLFQLSISYSSS